MTWLEQLIEDAPITAAEVEHAMYIEDRIDTSLMLTRLMEVQHLN